MCVEVVDENQYSKCGHKPRVPIHIEFCLNSPPGPNGPCPQSTQRLRNTYVTKDKWCFTCKPGQPDDVPRHIKETLHTPGVADAIPPYQLSVAAMTRAAAALQQRSACMNANPATMTTGGKRQSDENEVNFGDFVNDYDFGLDNTHNPPAANDNGLDNSVVADSDNGQQGHQQALESELDAEGETDPDYHAPVAIAAASDSDTQVSYNSELDAEGETDPDHVDPLNGAQEPVTSSDVDDDEYDEDEDESTECDSPDTGSIYEDEDEDEAQTHANAANVITRSMAASATRAQAHSTGKGKSKRKTIATETPRTKATNSGNATVTDNTAAAAATDTDAEDDDADDEASTTSSNMYDA